MDNETKGGWGVVAPIIIVVILFCLFVMSMTIG